MTDEERVELPADVARRLVDLLSRVEHWPLPLELQPASESMQRVVIPTRHSASMLYVDVIARPSMVHVRLLCNGGIPLGQHVFDLGEAPE